MKRNHNPLAVILTGAFLLVWTSVLISGESNVCRERDRKLANDKTRGFRVGAMCGPNCLWQIAYVHGRQYSLEAIERMARTNPQKGTTIKGMMAAAKEMGFQVDAVKTNIEALTQDPRIAILLLRLVEDTHYVIVDKAEPGNVRLLDGVRFRDMSVRQLKSVWDGYAILIGNHEDRRVDRSRWYLGSGLQISGLLILFVAATYGVRFAYLHSTKRH